MPHDQCIHLDSLRAMWLYLQYVQYKSHLSMRILSVAFMKGMKGGATKKRR